MPPRVSDVETHRIHAPERLSLTRPHIPALELSMPATTSLRVLSGLAVMLACAGLGGCRSQSNVASTDASTAAPALALPASAEPHPSLAGLDFMTGTWVCVNPNKTVNEEHWMPARGSVMVGTFRQVRRDGKCAFVEVTQISFEDNAVLLRQRHLHTKLEVPDERKEPSIFRVKSIGDGRAEFTGTGDAEGVSSVVYQRVNATTLTQTVSFDPAKSKEKPFTSTYTRVPQ